MHKCKHDEEEGAPSSLFTFARRANHNRPHPGYDWSGFKMQSDMSLAKLWQEFKTLLV